MNLALLTPIIMFDNKYRYFEVYLFQNVSYNKQTNKQTNRVVVYVVTASCTPIQ